MKTVDPRATVLPAVGLWLVTVDAVVSHPFDETFSPRACSLVSATPCLSPITFGTVTVVSAVVVGLSVVVGDGPLDTVRVTVEPLLAFAPAGGLVLITLPAATVSGACVLVVVLKPAWPRALPASDASCPTTLGMVVWPVPLETVRAIDEPFAAV